MKWWEILKYIQDFFDDIWDSIMDLWDDIVN